jgi:hypothetical protein
LISSAAACTVTLASKRFGARVMLCSTYAAASFAGSLRGVKRTPPEAGQPVDAEGPPALAAAIPRDEIPAAAEVDEGVRLDLAAAVGTVAAPIGKGSLGPECRRGRVEGGRRRRRHADGPVRRPPSGPDAVFTDPAGAAFSAWQANQHKGARIVNEPDCWNYSDLNTPRR